MSRLWTDDDYLAVAQRAAELEAALCKIRDRSDPEREQRQSEPQIVLDSIHAHAVKALAGDQQ